MGVNDQLLQSNVVPLYRFEHDWTNDSISVDMSFEQDRQETGETPGMRPWGGSGFGTEMVKDKTGPRFVGGQFSTEPRRPFISNYYRSGYLLF